MLYDAQVATAAGTVTAMHDPTEGGIAAALWELAEASGYALAVEPDAIPVPSLSARICAHFGLDPLATIASGALLLAVADKDVEAIGTALSEAGISWTAIGQVLDGPPAVYHPGKSATRLWRRPERDQIALAYEK